MMVVRGRAQFVGRGGRNRPSSGRRLRAPRCASRSARSTFSVSVMSWKVSMVAPSGSGSPVMQSSTLPSLRSSFSDLRAVVDRGDRLAQRQVSASSNSGLHQASTVSMWVALQPSADSFHIFSKAGLNSSTRPLPNTATASARLSSVVLDPGQPVVAACEIEALGDIVEQIGDAAFEVRRGDDADGAAVEPGVALGSTAR